MKPLKFSDVISETARRSGMGVEVTDALLRLYFKELRVALTSLSYPRVQVMNLGTFNLKPRTVEKKLCRKEALLDSLGDEHARSQQMRVEVEKDIFLMREAMGILERERERKGKVKGIIEQGTRNKEERIVKGWDG